MAVPPTYTLTVDLATITGQDVPDVQVVVGMADPQLINLGNEYLYPSTISRLTDADGVATFELMASSVVGDYSVSIAGGFGRVITMPASDSRLSQLMEA